MLDRLVGRAVLTDGDGVVRPHVQVRDLHEGGQTDGGALVVGEHEEGAAERTGVGAQQDAVGDAAHRELAHAEVQLTSELVADRPLLGGALRRSEGGSALEVGLVGAAEVGGAAPQFRHDGRDGVEDGAGGATGGDLLADLEGGLKIVEGLVEAFRQLAGLQTVVQGGLVRVGLAPGVELLVPFLVGFQTALGDLAGVGEGFLVDVEGLFGVVAEQLLEAGDGFGAQLGAMGGRVVGLARGRPCDQGVDLDELRLVRRGLLGLGDDLGQTLDVLLVGAVGLDEAELVGVAFAADGPDLVVERGLFLRGLRVEQAALEAFAVGEADGGGKALTQRAGGHFDAWGQTVLGVARGAGVCAAAEVLEVVQSDAVAGEVQLDVLGERSVATRKDEAIAAFPVGVVRIMLDEMLVEGVGDGRQGDGGTGVAASSLLNRVGRQDLGHVDGALVQLGLLEFGHGCTFLPILRAPRISAYAAPCMPSHCNPILTL